MYLIILICRDFSDKLGRKYVFHPLVLDAALHLALFHPAVVQGADKNSVFLLHKLGRVN
jgi:hypothetical protein